MEILSCGITDFTVQTFKCPQILSLKNNVCFFNPNPTLFTVSAIPSNNNMNKQHKLRCQSSNSSEEQDGFSEKTLSSKSQEGLPPQFNFRHSIYKEEAALNIKPKAPDFVPFNPGSSNFKLNYRGYVLLQFAPSAGDKQCDWGKIEAFSLSVTEIGALIALGATDSCEFCHDSFMGQSEEGKMRKVLKVEPLPDGSGHVFNLRSWNKFLDEDEVSISIPISKSELVVIVSGFNFILPYLLGWGAFVDSTKPRHKTIRIINPTKSSARLQEKRRVPDHIHI